MSEEPVPVAVIGAGNMGANHVRVYDDLPVTELVAVVEPDPDRAREIRAAYGVEVVEEIADLSGVDAVSICVPNQHHRDAAVGCAERGWDVLVEKPLALTIEDAEAIVEAAETNGVILQVGHIERFNPAVTTLDEILKSEEIIAVEAHRLGPFNEHLTTESVVFDLMIHDLDVIDGLVDSTVDALDAVGAISHSKEIDHAIAQFKFEDGIIGTATASHVTHGKIRTLNVTTRDAYIKLDYQEQKVTIQRRGLEQTTTLQNQSGYRTETLTETPFISTREPLKNELEHFVSCVRQRGQPRVGGHTGVSAVRLASAVIDRITDREGQVDRRS